MGVLGVGYGLSVTTTTVEAQASVPKEEIGVATSFNTLSRTIGQTVMVSLFWNYFERCERAAANKSWDHGSGYHESFD